MTHDHDAGMGHEPLALRTWGILGSALLLMISAVIIHLLIYWFLGELEGRRTLQPLPAAPQHREISPLQDEPPLQGTPDYEVWGPMEVKELRQREQKVLDGYGWVDPGHAAARVPIRRAMEMMLERGRP